MGIDSLRLRHPQLVQDLELAAAQWDHIGKKDQPIKIFTHLYTAACKESVTHMATHPIQDGGKKSKRPRKVQECLDL